MRHDVYCPRHFAPEPVSLWEFVSSALGAIALLGILLGSCTGARAIFAQETAPPHVRAAYVVGEALSLLEREWVEDTGAVERAYCLSDTSHVFDDGVEVHSSQFIGRALTIGSATSTHIRAGCPSHWVVAHTHSGLRLPSGQLVRDCNPSPTDYASLVHLGHAVGYIQCAKDVIVAYWPDGTSVVARADSSRARTVPPMPAGVFAAFLGVGVVANTVAHFDTDPGGYHDGWLNSAAFPRKLVHAVVGFGITSAATTAGVRPRTAFALTCAAAGAFEFTQGHPSWRDTVAGCGGAAVAALWRAAWAHR